MDDFGKAVYLPVPGGLGPDPGELPDLEEALESCPPHAIQRAMIP